MKGLGIAAALAIAAAGPAQALVAPRPGPGDPHIQSVEFDAEQVVGLSVALQYELTLEFSPDERVENVSVGDSAAWQVTTNKSLDRLFIKPVQGSVDTDMTVATDTRVYTFELKALPAPEPRMAYLVRFHYPVAPQASFPSAPAVGETVTYSFSGARELQPSAMTDDGRSTYIDWPDRAAIPAVSMIGPDGEPSLANGAVRDGRYVIDKVADRFIFRAGGKSASATRRVKKVGKS